MTSHESCGAQANHKWYTLHVEEKKIGPGITMDTADTFYTVLTFTYIKKKTIY